MSDGGNRSTDLSESGFDRDAEPILSAENLQKYYDTSGGFIDNLLGRRQLVKAVDGVDLELYEGETLGVVGESGCGKTTLGRSLLRLIEPTDGTVQYRGEDLTAVSKSRLRDLRTDIQYIFQDPFSSLNPRLTVSDIIGEPLEIHGWPWSDEDVETRAEVQTEGLSAEDVVVTVADDVDKVVDPDDGVATVHVDVRTGRDDRADVEPGIDAADGVVAEVTEPDLDVDVERSDDGVSVTVSVGKSTSELRRERIHELLEVVGLKSSHASRYPHEFSGGQRQRIGIARALAVDPDVIVCDEPVSALDVSVQAQILNLLEDLQDEFGLSYIFIAHDLSVVEHISDRIAVMYLGEIVEVGTTEEVFEPPHHPYAEALLSAIPEPDPLWEGDQIFLPGTVPSPIDPPAGCRFHTRCPKIIQPEEYDLEQSEWRSICNFRVRLRDAERLEQITAVEEEGDNELVDPTNASRDKLDHLVRSEFDIPSDVTDPGVESVLSNAIDLLYDEDFDAARDRLDDSLVSPCEQQNPPQIPTSDEHAIACLRYDDRYDEQAGWIEEDDAIASDVRDPSDSVADD